MTVWYRYWDHRVEAGYDGSAAEIGLREIPVKRETPKGVFLDMGRWDKPRFVLNEARKRWAYPTKELAMNSFRIRKKCQLGYLQAKIDHVNEVIALLPNEVGA